VEERNHMAESERKQSVEQYKTEAQSTLKISAETLKLKGLGGTPHTDKNRDTSSKKDHTLQSSTTMTELKQSSSRRRGGLVLFVSSPNSGAI